MSNKRLFAHNQQKNASDIIFERKNNTLLRFHRARVLGGRMRRFVSFEEFHSLLRQFYFTNFKEYDIQIPLSLRDSNSSFITYRRIKEHVAQCPNCINKREFPLDRCLTFKQILYPYGLFISDNIRPVFYLHNGLDFNDWCKPCLLLDKTLEEKREKPSKYISADTFLNPDLETNQNKTSSLFI